LETDGQSELSQPNTDDELSMQEGEQQKPKTALLGESDPIAALRVEVPPYVRFYSDQLKFLWEQYIKLIQLGILASALTVGFLMQYVVSNESTRKLFAIAYRLNPEIATALLGFAIVSAAFGALFFVVSRWCSQILMERQVYGQEEHAKLYFEMTKSILPTAIKPKGYTKKLTGLSESQRLLGIAGKLNEFAKFAGIVCVLSSWITAIIAGWPLIQSVAR
jgi:hypothetical protein